MHYNFTQDQGFARHRSNTCSLRKSEIPQECKYCKPVLLFTNHDLEGNALEAS